MKNVHSSKSVITNKALAEQRIQAKAAKAAARMEGMQVAKSNKELAAQLKVKGAVTLANGIRIKAA